MSNYRDFIFDLPSRCSEFLGSAGERCKAASEYEVTLMLMTAAIGLAPYERLEGGGSNHQFLEKLKFSNTKGQLEKLLESTVEESDLWRGHCDAWEYGEVNNGNGDVESWLTNSYPLRGDVRVKLLIRVIRNAIAHSIIKVRANGGRDGEITEIAFVSNIRNDDVDDWKKYNIFTRTVYLVTTPDGLKEFLKSWFAIVKSWDNSHRP